MLEGIHLEEGRKTTGYPNCVSARNQVQSYPTSAFRVCTKSLNSFVKITNKKKKVNTLLLS